MTDLVDTTEMYLRTIIDLEEEGISPFRARISERLGHSGPTVSQTVARMERDGLVVVEADRQLALTKKGRQKAIEVTRKHRLAERLLADVIGLDWSLVHEEACRWEHVMSEEVERKLLDLVSDPTISPFGMPVPGLELLGHAGSLITAVEPLTELEAGEYLLMRIGEPLQIDRQFLIQLKELELIPGETVFVTKSSEGWFLTNKSLTEGLVVDNHVAQHLFLGRAQEKQL